MAAHRLANDRIAGAHRSLVISYTAPMLRVFLAAPPHRDRADAWVRFAADGRVLAHGRDAPDAWPDDDHLEIVLAAQHVRLATLDLPPMTPERLRHAARFALEDQMASASDDAAIALTTSRPVVAAIASAALVRDLGAQSRPVLRIIPEPALAPRNAGWTWCASAAGGGFVRRADGSAFAVGSGGEDGALPAELQAALAQAQHAGVAPAAVHAAVTADPERLAAWTRATGVAFVPAPAWQWEHATPAMFAAAPDFATQDRTIHPAPTGSPVARRFRPAVALAVLALVVHAAALLVQWAWLEVTDWRLARAVVAQAAASGLPGAATPAAAAAAIARRNAELRHRAGKSASGDALPLLARAAPSIASLGGGQLKAMTYSRDAWTLELGKLDAQAVSAMTRGLTRAGIDAVSAPTPGGTRMRLTLDPMAR